MQAIEETFVPVEYNSNIQTCGLYDCSQTILSDFTERISHELSLFKQLEFYCMCESNSSQYNCFNQLNLNQLYPPQYYEDQFQTTKSKFKTKTQLFDEKISWLLSLLDKVYDCDSIIVGQARKIQRKCKSERRSAYIGVSRNGPNWQAIISSSKMKSYIGTYVNEIEAAEMFDLYSLLVHGFLAKTNFSYTKTGIINLINKHKKFSI